MSTLRCSGMRSKDNKRCGMRVRQEPDVNGKVWCRYHTPQRKHSSKSPKTISQKEAVPVQCTVCLEEVSPVENANLSCGHDFHLSCIKNLRDIVCPNCRAPLVSPRLKKKDIDRIQKRLADDKREREQENFDGLIGVIRSNDWFDFILIQMQVAQLLDDAIVSYDNMLRLVRENSNDEEFRTPEKVIFNLLKRALTSAGSIAGTHAYNEILHDRLLIDVPPLFPQTDIGDIHQQIHTFLELPPI